MKSAPLITFAVRAEANPARRRLRQQGIPAQFLLTGIGPQSATQTLARCLAHYRPTLVLSCGFAGALHPNLKTGQLVVDVDPGFPLAPQLDNTGARSVSFCSSSRILATAREKADARARFNADAVEMESTAIRQLCREEGIPSATFRVISDAADEDLPLDFNRFLATTGRLRYHRLALALLQSPALIPTLIRFQRQTRKAAQALGTGLCAVLADG